MKSPGVTSELGLFYLWERFYGAREGCICAGAECIKIGPYLSRFILFFNSLGRDLA